MPNCDQPPDWDAVYGELVDNDAGPDTLAQCKALASRRRFLGWSGGGVMLALGGLGAGVDAALRGLLGRGLLPVAWAQPASGGDAIDGKPEMEMLISRPVSGQFAPHLLDDDVTPTARHYVRNNGGVSQRAAARDAQGWSLTIDGEVHKTLTLSLDDLRSMPSVTMPLLIECAGNGRAFFDPPVRGNPWGRGAIGCSEWTGVPLRDVLKRAGLKSTAKYTGQYGDDLQLGSNPPFSRGIPIDKAMEEHTLIAYQMNGADLHPLNGFPARLVVPGWAGSCSQKWLNRIWIRDCEHDSQKMKGYSYRVPKFPVAPGTRPPEEDMQIVTSWPVKSMITRPAADAQLKLGDPIGVRGHAWAGEATVTRVAVSTDYGVNWHDARLSAPPNKYAWQRWNADVTFNTPGYYEIWARAFDDAGNAQPFRQPWNPKGYMGNVIHRLPVTVSA